MINTANLSRRNFLHAGAVASGGLVLGGALAACSSGGSATGASTTSTTLPVTNADEALARLMAGNQRFIQGKQVDQGRDSVRRVALAETQSPFVIIVGCSDSRVVPEVIFDEGLGDMFLVRAAGNTGTDPVLLGSIEYSVAVLGSVLLMVLSHQDCGAVKAALKQVQGGAPPPGDIPAVLAPILPAAQSAKGDASISQLDAAIQQNVRNQVAALGASPAILQPAVAAGKLKIVGAEYQLASGKVKLLD
jgi:carbonic anhydrase